LGFLQQQNESLAVNDIQPFLSRRDQQSREPIETKRILAYLSIMLQRIFIIGSWVALIFVAYSTLSPIDARPTLADPQIEHFAAFFVMGFAFCLAYPSHLRLVAAVVIGAAFGLEMLQLLTPDRHARALDAVVKAAGGICGISLGQFGWFLLRLKSAQTDSPI
jgi:VanZ family protein